jgi:hypothetical protein
MPSTLARSPLRLLSGANRTGVLAHAVSFETVLATIRKVGAAPKGRLRCLR